MNKLRVFESFAGIGSQTMALKNLNIEYEVVGISEVDKYAILAYDVIHKNYTSKQNNKQTKDEMLKHLLNINVAYNFSTGKSEMPKSEEDIKQLYNACIKTNNYGDIRKIISENLPDFDLFTYSFPCKNITNEGKQAGFDKGSETQSSLVWDCEEIIKTKKPKYLLMENVKNIVSKKNMPTFQEWCDLLNKMGYNNYWKIYNAKKYGLPQNRERVLMASILKEHDIGFIIPNEIPLHIKLADLLEHEIDDKYYIEENAYNRLITQDKIINELPTVRVREATKQGYAIATVGDSINTAQYNSKTRRGRVGHSVAQTITTTCWQCTLEKDGRVRRLTPLECWRLQGLRDEDYYKSKDIAKLPETKLYERAGRCIPITILEAIFKNMFNNQIY